MIEMAYLYRELDHDRDGNVGPKKHSVLCLRKDGKYSDMEFAGMENPNISNADYDLDKSRKF